LGLSSGACGAARKADRFGRGRGREYRGGPREEAICVRGGGARDGGYFEKPAPEGETRRADRPGR